MVMREKPHFCSYLSGLPCGCLMLAGCILVSGLSDIPSYTYTSQKPSFCCRRGCALDWTQEGDEFVELSPYNLAE